MDLVKWEPFRDVISFRDEVDRLFDGFFGRMPARRERAEFAWMPPIDFEEDKDAYVVKTELPGMKKEDVKISLSGDRLHIAGERSREKEEEGKTFHRVERAYGRFERVLTLPGEVDGARVKATYKDGILAITLPKSEKVKPKEIGIEVK
jgi:HSP20 family protein